MSDDTRPMPPKRGRPRKVVQGSDRLTDLTAREQRLASRARMRKRYTFDLPLDLYERLLDEAESYDQPLPDVVRACILRGLDVIKKFGSPSATNPYVYGKLDGARQVDIDPTGTAWPPTGNTFELDPVHFPGPQHQAAYQSPTLKPGMLPNGYTAFDRDITRPEPTDDSPATPAIGPFGPESNGE